MFDSSTPPAWLARVKRLFTAFLQPPTPPQQRVLVVVEGPNDIEFLAADKCHPTSRRPGMPGPCRDGAATDARPRTFGRRRSIDCLSLRRSVTVRDHHLALSRPGAVSGCSVEEDDVRSRFLHTWESKSMASSGNIQGRRASHPSRVARYRSSGLSMARFCEQERVAANTFYYSG